MSVNTKNIQGQVTGAEADISGLVSMLRAYGELSRKTLPEVVAKKGNDLRIRLWSRFWAIRWQGPKSIVDDQFASRKQIGKGILVRLRSLSDRFLSVSGKKLPEREKTKRVGAREKRKLTLWQKLVWQELQRRKWGMGVLGLTFLTKRWADKKGGRVLVSNRSGNIGGSYNYDKKSLRIRAGESGYELAAFTPGITKMASKHGILQGAISDVMADMEPYLRRKMEEAAKAGIPQLKGTGT